MEPRIQFTRTSDGVSIAYAAAGEGPCLIIVPPPPLSHAQRQWHLMPELYQGLAQRFRSIWYDSRGSGLSDRHPIDFSMQAMIRDLEAVAGRAGGSEFALFGNYDAVPIAITYAAAWPERVTHLILCDGRTKFSDYLENPASILAEEALREQDWILYTETLARVLLGFDDPIFAAQFGEHIRACVEPEALRAAYAAQMAEEFDVPEEVLASVSAPTLVLHNRKNRFLPVQSGQRIASSIADARFMVIDDMMYRGLPELIADFIDDANPESRPPSSGKHAPKTGKEAAAHSEGRPAAGQFVTIVFTDVERNTEILQRLGDAAWRGLLREHEQITRGLLKQHSGAEIKTIGDAFMASFGSATSALECAVALQRAFTERNESAGEPMQIRIGVNAGEPIAEDGDLFGTSVTMASRIAGIAAGGEIVASNVVRELVAGKGFLFADRGEFVAKGFEEPVRVYEVRWRN